MKYSEKVVFGSMGYDDTNPDHIELSKEIRQKNPRFNIACYGSFYRDAWLPELNFNGGKPMPLYGVGEIRRAIPPFDRTKEAMLSHEIQFTKLDHQSQIPDQPEWNRDLYLRENQYSEHHPALAEWQGGKSRHVVALLGKLATGGDIRVQYRNYSGRISGLALESVDGAPTWVMASELEHKDGSSVGDGIIEITASHSKEIIEKDLDWSKNHALIMGTMACYWEIDKVLGRKG